jgi:hypothetical protein
MSREVTKVEILPRTWRWMKQLTKNSMRSQVSTKTACGSKSGREFGILRHLTSHETPLLRARGHRGWRPSDLTDHLSQSTMTMYLNASERDIHVWSSADKLLISAGKLIVLHSVISVLSYRSTFRLFQFRRVVDS